MVRKEFELPDVGEGVAEGELVTWFVEPGDQVEEDQPIAEVETDKALVEIPSPYDGTVAELRAEEGEIVPVDDVIVVFEVDDADVDATSDISSETDTGDAATASTDSSESAAGAPEPTAQPELPDGRVFASPSVRRLARENGVDLAELQSSNPGTRIDERAVLEATGDIESTEPDGWVEATPPAADDADTDAAQATATSPSASSPEPVASSADAADRERTLAMPATRQLAREEGVNIDDVPASEERDGEPFVTPEDVRAFAAGETTVASAGSAADSESSPATGSASAAAAAAQDGLQPGETVPYRGVRRSIGEQMATSKFTAPHVSHHDEVEVSDLVDARGRLKETAEELGVKLTYMPFVVKAVVAALKSVPQINAELDEEAEEIHLKDEYNIGIAVASDAGLMVPVIDDADQKSLLELAREINDKAARARDRTIGLEEMQGGTFTITNVGAIGGEYASPIINYPEAGILALGSLDERPWVDDGELVVRPTMPISMSVDHRIVDGADAARFTNEVTRYLNNPELLLLE
ncbi:2-oxo acid dehydrogenase subunit E2 [Natrarchaeobaculum aegyptiacum]|uniref:Branched-chain alpha-keto acid dehydrogenase subunit E2 n=1 Tax=Natrarchaeobaculum aegyptiacum TaxID=745377 RepID=A0A2Z2HUS7_9EURY|nr:2-oxo acid dehydrogenase subunit E2 [Natrarchaeobaculum aegyptiacum]ARS91019.1 branched-chain alpha-keto acid dehydrogenase subunit E2 [Natrarchaeobaculum aegyptiacum]